MRIFFSCFLVLWINLTGFSQKIIKGYVKDQKGNPIVSANVFIKDTYDGASSDTLGYFQFESGETGINTLIATFIGFKQKELMVDMNNLSHIFELTLQEEINKLEAVVISAGSFSTGDAVKAEVLKPIDIVTTAGALGDISGALNTLPGTQIVGEDGRLFVRGGTGNETKIFIDGMQVLNAYNSTIPNTPTRGRFNPMMFKGTNFSTGGYSAEYGQALSSALILDTKDVASIDRADISIMSVGLDAAATKVWDKSSLAAKVQYTNIAPYFSIIKQNIKLKEPPQSIEGNWAFRQKIRKDGLLKLYGNFQKSSLVSLQSDIDDPEVINAYDLENGYHYINATYRDIINEKWSFRGGMAYTVENEEIGLEAFKVKEHQDGWHIKTSAFFDANDKLGLNMGVEIFSRSYDERLIEEDHDYLHFEFNETIVAGFTEFDLYTSNKFLTRAGLRYEYNAMTDRQFINPRISLGYKTGKYSQVSMAFGQFQQTVEDNILKINDQLSTEKANHYIINYQWLTGGRSFRTELYYKRYFDLVKFDEELQYNPVAYQNEGSGYAKGIEVFWRDNQTFKNVDYWLSYSYLDTERNFRVFPYSATPTFASKHNLSFVYKHFISDIRSQFGMTLNFASPRFYNNPNNPGFNNESTKAYHDLSLNYTYLWRSNIIFHAIVTNVYNRKNVFGYEYSHQLNEMGEYNGRAIVPMAPRFIFIGVFITFSSNKSLNELPNL